MSKRHRDSMKICLKRPRKILRNLCLLDLPSELILKILMFLEPNEVASKCMCVSSGLSCVATDYWRNACDELFSFLSFCKKFEKRHKGGDLTWMMEYKNLIEYLHAFRSPDCCREISFVYQWGKVAYLQEGIQLDSIPICGVYIEFVVSDVCDELSLSLVDFDGVGGCSSLTFSPYTGEVIKEKKVSEYHVIGEYCQCLSEEPEFGKVKNRDKMSVHISHNGEISFYRNTRNSALWESAGIVSNCHDWVMGGIVTPCVAFQNVGTYTVRVEKIRAQFPPIRTIKFSAEWTALTDTDSEHSDI